MSQRTDVLPEAEMTPYDRVRGCGPDVIFRVIRDLRRLTHSLQHFGWGANMSLPHMDELAKQIINDDLAPLAYELLALAGVETSLPILKAEDINAQ